MMSQVWCELVDRFGRVVRNWAMVGGAKLVDWCNATVLPAD